MTVTLPTTTSVGARTPAPTATGAVRGAPTPDRVSRRGPDGEGAADSRPPATDDTDRRLLAAASRALREAGWTPDRHTPAAWRHGLWRDDQHGIAWTVEDGVAEIEVWRRVAGRDDMTEARVTSVQQAVDLVAALTGACNQLTTGARIAGAWREHVRVLEVELGYQRRAVAAGRARVAELEDALRGDAA